MTGKGRAQAPFEIRDLWEALMIGANDPIGAGEGCF
jgi:hypothetical protein